MQKLFSIYLNACMMSLIITACNSSIIEEIPFNEEEQTAIGFNAKVQASRAIADLDAVKTNGFSVWGGFDGLNVFKETKVKFENSVWTYSPTAYWTLNNTYKFYAIYPFSVDVEMDADYTTGTIKNFDATTKTDLLLASSQSIVTGNISYEGEVGFYFNHQLARLNFSIENASGTDVKLYSVKLYGVNYQGDYCFTDETPSWKNIKLLNTINTPYSFASGEGQTLSDGVKYTFPKNDLSDVWLLPQVDLTGATLEVAYLYGGSTGAYINKKIPLSTIEVPKWESGRQYSYSFTITELNIVFKPVVEEWKESMGNIVTVE